MSPRSRPGSATTSAPGTGEAQGRHRGDRRRRFGAAGIALLLLALLVTGCSSTFDPTGPCSGDGSKAGAYPELEALIPKTYAGADPAQLDSGRSCTTEGLGTLAGHGVSEVHFAGGTWTTGTQSGLSLAVFANPGGSALDPAWISEFYAATAAAGKNVTSIDQSTYDVGGGVSGQRIDVLNGESFQSVVVWGQSGQVHVALVADFIREIQTKEAHDKVVRAAVDSWQG